MTRVNILLLLAAMASALFLVRTQYESRRVFVELDRANAEARKLELENDRLEVESPGLLPPGLTVEDLRQGVSKLRNRVIGRVFQELGLIEQWGSGIQRMSSACRDAGLPPPQLEEIGMRFRVTLHTSRDKALPLEDIDQALLNLLADGHGHSTTELATQIKRSSRAARTRLASLVERGLVREIGSSAQDPKRRYFKASGD